MRRKRHTPCHALFLFKEVQQKAVIIGVDLFMSGERDNAFAFVRPPGHHAEKERAMGFCVFNNVARAARHVMHRYGNGTSTGFPETGSGKGEGDIYHGDPLRAMKIIS